MKWEELVELIRTTPAPDEAPSVPDNSLKLPDDDAGDIVILGHCIQKHIVSVLLWFFACSFAY
mgnify:CR=1 FL=1